MLVYFALKSAIAWLVTMLVLPFVTIAIVLVVVLNALITSLSKSAQATGLVLPATIAPFNLLVSYKERIAE